VPIQIMSGLKFLLNGQELASISNRDRNIISAYVAGDVIGPELATAHMTGGYYGEPKETDHRIWLDGVEINEGDEIEIQFLETISTSGPGLSIEELAAANANDTKSEEPDREDIFAWLARQPKVRERFLFELETSKHNFIKSKTLKDDFSFHFGVMWKWTTPNEASVRLTSTSLENMKKEVVGKKHGQLKLEPGQWIKFRVGT